MLQSCQSEKKIDNIIVREDRSYEYDLSKGEGIINNTDRSVYKKFKFHKISEAKIQHISELYHEKKLNTNPGSYNFLVRSCSSVASRSLLASGYFAIGGVHPYLLRASIWLREIAGIRPSILSHNLLTNYNK